MSDHQFQTRSTSLLKIMISADFGRGVQDGRSGAPWPKDLDIPWNYERGRMFGVMHPDVPVKIGRGVTYEAQRLAALAVLDRAII
jgi:hypothetical protein